MSATLGLEPRMVVRDERWILRDARRSAVLAASSEGEAIWCAVVTKSEMVDLSWGVYYVDGQCWVFRQEDRSRDILPHWRRCSMRA